MGIFLIFFTVLSWAENIILKYMLKEKAEGISRGLQRENAGNSDITKLLFDIADFDFALINMRDSIKKMKNLIMKYSGASSCTLMFLDNYGYLWKVGEKTTYPFKLGEGIAGWSAKCQKRVFVNDVSSDKRYKPLYKNRQGAMVSVPVVKNGKTLGIISLTYSKEKLKLYPPNNNVLDIFVKKMRVVLENVFLYYVAENEKNELRARKSISKALEENISLEEKVEIIRKNVVRFTSINDLSIYLEDEKSHEISCLGGAGKKNITPTLDLMNIYFNKKGKKHDFLDLSEKFDFNFITKRGSGYITMYPIFSKSKIMGYILIEEKIKNIDNLSVLEKRFIELASSHLGEYLVRETSSKKIIEEKEKWRTIFHNVDDGIILLSRDKIVIEANLKAREILGSKNTSLIGANFFSLFKIINPEVESPTLTSIKNLDRFKKSDKEELEKKIDKFFSSQKVIRPQEYYIQTKSGKYWIIGRMKTAIQDPNSELFGIIHIKDITKSNEVEQDKNEFMSMVSHELRTPLSAMKGYLSMILNSDYGKLSKKQEKSLKRVEESNERMVVLVEDILDVSRIELGRFNLNKEPINLSNITRAMVRELGAKIQEKNITLKIQNKLVDPCLKKTIKNPEHTCNDLGVYVLADRDRLMQILGNLIDNAIKYSFDGGKIDINIKPDKNFVEILVKDDGVGVRKEDQDKLFRRFSRIHNPLSIQAGGTGLGLYITKKLILAHNGNISVSSKQGKGTTFSVKMPIAKQLPLI